MMLLSPFLPHAVCYLFRPDVIALHVGSDLIIAGAYYMIPTLLWRLIYLKIGNAQIRSIGWWFMAFILLCGLTHIMEVLVIWAPWYYVSGMVKAVTGAVSVMTCYRLWQLSSIMIPMLSAALLNQDEEAIRTCLLYYGGHRRAPPP